MMATSARVRELFFNNLLILGFDKDGIEKECKITCNKDMFCVANRKLFELVTHFLFTKLNEVSKNKYKYTWPLFDTKDHRQFVKDSFTHFTSIAQESAVRFPRIVLSMLSTFCGDSFYDLYLAFSSHVVERTIRKNGNVQLISRPTVSEKNFKDVTTTLKTLTIISVEKFQELQMFSKNHLEMLLKCSSNLIDCIQKLKLNLAASQRLQEEKSKALIESNWDGHGDKPSLSSTIAHVIKFMTKVQELWASLELFLDKEPELWSYLCSEVEANQEKNVLDGASLNFISSETFKEMCPGLNECESRLVENNNVHLTKYLRMLVTILDYYVQNLIKDDLHQMQYLGSLERASNLEENLNTFKSLNNRLMEIIPNIKENIEKLQEKHYPRNISENLEVFTKECPSFSFTSKSLKDEISSSRSLPSSHLTNEIGKSTPSLLLKDSGNDEISLVAGRQSLNSLDVSALSYTNPDTNSFLEKSWTQESLCLTPREVDSKSEECSVTEDSHRFSMPGAILSNKEETSKVNDSLLVSPKKNGEVFTFVPDPVFDIDLDFSRPFTMRASWHLEDSLNSMTLPEAPELE